MAHISDQIDHKSAEASVDLEFRQVYGIHVNLCGKRIARSYVLEKRFHVNSSGQKQTYT